MRRAQLVVTGVAATLCLLGTSLPALADEALPTPPAEASSAPAAPEASPDPAATEPSSDSSTAASPTPSVLVTSAVEAPASVAASGVVLVVPPSTIVMRTVTFTGIVEGEPATGVTPVARPRRHVVAGVVRRGRTHR